MDTIKYVLVVGDVKSRQYKVAQFDLRKAGIPTRVLRMTNYDWQLANVETDVLYVADKAHVYPSDSLSEHAYYKAFAERFPHDAGSRPIADGSKFVLDLTDIVDMQAQMSCTPRIAAARLVIDTPTARVVGLVMSEAAFHWDFATLAWFNQLHVDVARFCYVVRPDGSVEIV